MACCMVGFSSNALAQISSGETNPALVNRFFSGSDNIIWFSTSADLKKSIADLVNNAPSYGLDKSNYHPDQLKSYLTTTETDSTRLKNIDRVYADALISFCKDLYMGRDINNVLSYDEVSDKNFAKDNDRIITMVRAVRTPADLAGLIKTIEPSDQKYTALKTELATQIAQNNTDKVNQLENALNLHRWIHHFAFDKYIVVNIPTTAMSYYDHNAELITSKVVVGKPSKRTPRFSAYCNEVVFYPYWNVPASIASNELIPKFKKNPAAIDKLNIQVVDDKGNVIDHSGINWAQYSGDNFPYKFRQSTGCENSLGVIKFNLTDPFDVYMHDTNAKKLFESKSRFFSHGCIRVEKALELGSQLLPDKIDEAYLSSCFKDEQPKYVKLPKPVPVFVVYSTVDVNDSGAPQYYADVYHLLK